MLDIVTSFSNITISVAFKNGKNLFITRFQYKMLHQNKWDVIRSHLCHIISTKLEIPNFLLLVISLE